MKELNFKFARNLNYWELIQVKESFSKEWLYVPDNLRDPDELPIYLTDKLDKIKPYRRNYATITYLFDCEKKEADFVDKNGNLQIRGVKLLDSSVTTLASNEKLIKKEQRIRLAKIRKLKFNPLVDDVAEWANDFLELFEGEDKFSSKLELSNFTKLEDQDFFNPLVYDDKISLEHMAREFVVKYEKFKLDQNDRIKNLKPEDCSNIAEFVNKKFDYLKTTLKQNTFKSKLKAFIHQLPSNLKVFFKDEDLPRLFNENKIIVFLEYHLKKTNPNQAEEQMDVQQNVPMKELDREFNKPEFNF